MSTQTRIPGTQRPTDYQFGDRVRAVLTTDAYGDWQGECPYEAGTQVEGVIVEAVNADPMMLHRGRVEVRLDSGHRLWVQALEVLETRYDREHPLTIGLPVTMIPWSCGCGASGSAVDETAARDAHLAHQHRAR